uniref:CCHC-type domain-containing protein n=1 Tax=Quercus lobata TaxID=97700 RepID=A0A7N2R804_QUELO
MSVSNEEPEIISLCDDLVEDLVHVEPKIVENQNNVDLPMNDLNQSFASKWPLEPCLDMVFNDLEDAHACYKAYARRKGFSIRINHKWSSKEDKSLVGVEYICWREGFRHKSYENKERKDPKPAKTRMGCKAMMSLKKKEEARIVTKFVDNHNHELLTPMSTSLLRGHRVISRAQKNLIDTLNESSVPTRKIMSVLSNESGGDYNVGCVAVDVQNYLGSKRRKLLQDGDTWLEAMLGRAPSTIITDDDKAMEVGSQSMKKYEHLDLALQKVHVELLAMHDIDDLVSSDNTILNSQVLSNLPGALQDPPYVLSKGRPKSLRQKNPKENQPTKKRKCSICKETGHVRRTCPSISFVQDSLPSMRYPPTSSTSMPQGPHSSSLWIVRCHSPTIPREVKYRQDFVQRKWIT